MDRLSHLSGKLFDIVIIGGGIVGSGILRDAALRGLSVALFEKEDYGSGTTAKSTRLIHGGLRYLETLDFGLVRMDLREREILLRIAGHLVRPLPFVVPMYERSLAYRCKLRAGMVLYDLLSLGKTLPAHQRLSYAALVKAEPLLDRGGLQGGFLYHDAQVEAPERLGLENVIDAREHGAEAHNYAEVMGALRSGGAIQGVRVRDCIHGNEIAVKGRVVVNAGGPWVDQILNRMGASGTPKVRMTKGIHFVCPPLSKAALVLFSRTDSRLFFAVPWFGQSLVGTTDTNYFDDPESAQTEKEDVEYLLSSIRTFIPSLTLDQVKYSYAGIRSLVPEKGKPSSISRMHRIDEGKDEQAGLLSVIGGKITGHRAIAEEVVNIACARLGIRRDCRTASTPLPGCRPSGEPPSPKSRTAQHLQSLYGSRSNLVMELAGSNPRLREPLAPEYPDIRAQVIYSVRHEQCLHLSDFLLRRSMLGFYPDQGRAAVPAVIALMARELNWPDTRMSEEFESYMELIRAREISAAVLL